MAEKTASSAILLLRNKSISMAVPLIGAHGRKNSVKRYFLLYGKTGVL